MDTDKAIEYLTEPKGKKTSEIGEAVETLYRKYGSYAEIARKLPLDMPDISHFLSSRRRIFQLPKGIQWKIDHGQIESEQGYQISRLRNEDDQWLLAFAVVEENLKLSECENVVNIVLRKGRSIKDALDDVAGVKSDTIHPLMLPIGFDLRLAMCRLAWNQRKNWADLCYELIRQGIDVDIKEAASQLEALASKLHAAGQKKSEE